MCAVHIIQSKISDIQKVLACGAKLLFFLKARTWKMNKLACAGDSDGFNRLLLYLCNNFIYLFFFPEL